MTEFNENPFKKDTPVVPFSNGTEYEIWQEHNCHKCMNYESESKNEENAKCILAYHLDLGSITGDIPLWVVKEIGCEYDPLYQYCALYSRCKKLHGFDDPF
jgi:hypothetical protein